MRQVSRVLAFWIALLAITATVSCGGGDESAPTSIPTVTSSAPSPTTAAAPAVASTPPAGIPITPAPSGIGGTVLEKAILPPIELDNIRYGGTLVWPTVSSNALDPKLNNSGIWPDVRSVYESLVEYQSTGENPYMQLVPKLAESWSVSSDLMTYTFKLRKGIRWQNVAPANGREFVASDAVFSMNRYREKDAVAYSFYEQIASIETPDKYTVVVKVKEPTAYLLQDLFANLDYVVLPELVAEGNGTLTSKAVGTGPYIMKRFAIRQGSSHVRNPDYWGKDAKGNPLPYTDALEVPYIADNGTAIAAFRAGQVDFTAGTGGGPGTDNIIALSKTTGLRVYKTGAPIGGQGFTFRTDKAPWNDIRVRKAFNHAIDKQKFGDTVIGPGRWIHSGPLPFSLFFGRDEQLSDLGPYAKYDPAETKRLLIEAGFKDGKFKVPTPLAASQSSSYGPRTATFQALYKENGIEFDLQSMDMATYNPFYFNRALQDIGLTHHILAQANLNWFAQVKWNPNSVQNTAIINDPEVNRILKEIKITSDPVKMKEYARFLWDFDTLGSYTVWTPVENSYALSSARIRNWTYRLGGGQGFFMFMWLGDAPRTSP